MRIPIQSPSVRWMLKAILVSPKFLYRVEPNRPERSAGEVFPVSDQELAVRLSYFLWSSMSDDELLDLAQRGRLSASGPSNEPVKFPGLIIAGPGSDSHQGNNAEKVFGGDLLTVLDGPNADSYWVGLDLGKSQPVQRLRYAGRIGLEQRMVGGKFQASDSANFSTNMLASKRPSTSRPPGSVAPKRETVGCSAAHSPEIGRLESKTNPGDLLSRTARTFSSRGSFRTKSPQRSSCL